MEPLEKRIEGLEERLVHQQASLELVTGFIESRFGKKDFLRYLKQVAESGDCSKEAQAIAKEHLQDEARWVRELNGKQSH